MTSRREQGVSESNISHHKRVFLWTMPRSRATVLCKCMSFVEGAQVWYEPYLYSYHNEILSTGGDPEEIRREAEKGLEEMRPLLDNTPIGRRFHWTQFRYSWVKQQLDLAEKSDTELTFIKDSAFAMENNHQYLPNTPFIHTFLVRNPHQMYPSYRSVFLNEVAEEDRNMYDIIEDAIYPTKHLYEKTYNFWRYIAKQTQSIPIVIDGDELVTHPEKILPKYFDAIGVPFNTKYLTWDSQDTFLRKWKTSYEAIVSCADNGWITKAVLSSHFLPAHSNMNTAEMTDDVKKCIEYSMPYYDVMIKHRIRP